MQFKENAKTVTSVYYSAKTEFMFSRKFFVNKLVAKVRTGKCS